MDIDIAGTKTVTVVRKEIRGSADCPDHDRYRLEIRAENHLGEPLLVDLTLYAAPGADIGLGPLVDEDGYDSGYCDGLAARDLGWRLRDSEAGQ